MPKNDTIAAIATAPGKGGVGIIRVSGPQTEQVCQALFEKKLTPRHAHYLPFKSVDKKNIYDKGIALYFSEPNSYTGEDVLELQGHGGPVVLNMLLKEILAIKNTPVRLAEPGEFTQRAYLNDKMDLAQAEAVADLIESSSEQAAKAAAKSLSGTFSEAVYELLSKLTYVRIYLEAALDFPEEEIDFLADKELQERINQLENELAAIKNNVRQGQLIKDGMTVVILGQPNAGKSSLLNQLTGNQSAIVTDIAGTTRDVLREHIHIDGLPLHIIDTAGLRETTDQIEQEGVKRAWKEVEKADRILLLIDKEKGFSEAEQKIIKQLRGDSEDNPIPIDFIYNKIDQQKEKAFIEQKKHGVEIGLSALTGEGINLLTQHLKESMGFEQSNETLFSARQRHMDALVKIEEHIAIAIQQFKNNAAELSAEELRLAQEQLASITGEFHSDDLLGEIFSGFCIGK